MIHQNRKGCKVPLSPCAKFFSEGHQMHPLLFASAISDGSNPPSGPIKCRRSAPVQSAPSLPLVAAMPRSFLIRQQHHVEFSRQCDCLPGNSTGSLTTGILLRFDCFAALFCNLLPARRLCRRFFASSFTTQFFIATGITSAAPSSTAFWTMSSILSLFEVPETGRSGRAVPYLKPSPP